MLTLAPQNCFPLCFQTGTAALYVVYVLFCIRISKSRFITEAIVDTLAPLSLSALDEELESGLLSLQGVCG